MTSNRGGRLAPLLIGVATRQAASRTATVQAALEGRDRAVIAHECCVTTHKSDAKPRASAEIGG